MFGKRNGPNSTSVGSMFSDIHCCRIPVPNALLTTSGCRVQGRVYGLRLGVLDVLCFSFWLL